jgi:hypothetical protein
MKGAESGTRPAGGGSREKTLVGSHPALLFP